MRTPRQILGVTEHGVVRGSGARRMLEEDAGGGSWATDAEKMEQAALEWTPNQE